MAKVRIFDRRDEDEKELFVSVEFEQVDILESGNLGALGREKETALLTALGKVTALEAELVSAKRALLLQLQVVRAENE